MYRVEFYRDKNGNSDIIDLLDELKEIEQARLKQKDFLRRESEQHEKRD